MVSSFLEVIVCIIIIFFVYGRECTYKFGMPS